jgi:hypothetical protein
VNDLWAAAVALVAVAKKARKRLAGTNVMGQKLDKPLVDEIDAVLAYAERAIDEEEQRAMQDARRRGQIRALADESRARGRHGA